MVLGTFYFCRYLAFGLCIDWRPARLHPYKTSQRSKSFVSPLEVKFGRLHVPTWAVGGGGLGGVSVCSSEIASSAESINNEGDVAVASCVLAKLLLSWSAIKVLLLLRHILKVQTRMKISSARGCSHCVLSSMHEGSLYCLQGEKVCCGNPSCPSSLVELQGTCLLT